MFVFCSIINTVLRPFHLRENPAENGARRPRQPPAETTEASEFEVFPAQTCFVVVINAPLSV